MIAKIAHEKFLDMINDSIFKENIPKNTIEQRIIVEKKLASVENAINPKNKLFIEWILEQSRSNFYFYEANNEFALIKRNFKGMLVVGYKKPGLKTLKPFLDNNEYSIELINIHSGKKGEGHKMMKLFIELVKKTNLTTYLWTESEKNIEFFERYGFKNQGQVGSNKEYLMILERSK